MTAMGDMAFGWDARGRLEGMTGSGVEAGFAYDPVGRRAARTVNGKTTGYLITGQTSCRR